MPYVRKGIVVHSIHSARPLTSCDNLAEEIMESFDYQQHVEHEITDISSICTIRLNSRVTNDLKLVSQQLRWFFHLIFKSVTFFLIISASNWLIALISSNSRQPINFDGCEAKLRSFSATCNFTSRARTINFSRSSNPRFLLRKGLVRLTASSDKRRFPTEHVIPFTFPVT